MKRKPTPTELALIKRRELGKICSFCGEKMSNYKKRFCCGRCQILNKKDEKQKQNNLVK